MRKEIVFIDEDTMTKEELAELSEPDIRPEQTSVGIPDKTEVADEQQTKE